MKRVSEISLPHEAAIIVAAVFISQGGVLTKRFPPNRPIMTNAIGMTVCAVFLDAASLASGKKWTLLPTS